MTAPANVTPTAPTEKSGAGKSRLFLALEYQCTVNTILMPHTPERGPVLSQIEMDAMRDAYVNGVTAEQFAAAVLEARAFIAEQESAA